tara:strand:- start:449 stop:1330 length:882 start_codon:yes stop_codon:yes gene_type:complete
MNLKIIGLLTLVAVLVSGCTTQSLDLEQGAPQEQEEEQTLSYNQGLQECYDIDAPSGQTYCLEQLIEEESINNASFCNTVNGAWLKNHCNWVLAEKNRDVSLCENISNDTNFKNAKENCVVQVAKSLDDASLCELAVSEENGERDKYRCYFTFATRQNDFSLCGKIIDPPLEEFYSQDNCSKEVATGLGDSSKCGELTDIDIKDSCYFEFARKDSNLQLCENISNSDNKLYCEAIVSADDSKCNVIQNIGTKDKCYLVVASEANDPSLCEEIQNATVRNLCEKYFEFGQGTFN